MYRFGWHYKYTFIGVALRAASGGMGAMGIAVNSLISDTHGKTEAKDGNSDEQKLKVWSLINSCWL